MTGTVYSAVLDGVSNFTLHDDTFSWGSNGYLSNIDEWGGDGPDINTFSLFLSGNWDIGNLHLGGWALTNISDANDGVWRNIETLRLPGFGGTLNLTTTHIEVLKTYSIDGRPGNADITLGTAGIDFILLNNGNDTVRGGDGGIDTLRLGGGNNTFVGGSGFVGVIRAFDGNDTVTLTGGADAISLGSGNDKLILQANAQVETAYMGDGNNIVTLADGARISMLKGDDGNDTVTLNGAARIYSMKLDGGNNTVTTASGNVESLFSFSGNNTLNIGSGGVGQIILAEGTQQNVTAAGFIGSLLSYGNSSTTAVLNGGAINVFTGHGNDRVTTGNGTAVSSLITEDGNDTVVMGVDAVIDSLHLDPGNDVFKLNTVKAGYAVTARGGDGTDLLDFGQMTTGVNISLNLNGAYQKLGAGTVSIVEFENMNGSAQSDFLEGNGGVNKINGFGGNDTLRGLGGNDVLAGGKGNDTLTGGTGADVFEFGAGGGKDHITDFSLVADHIHFLSATKLADITFTAQAGGVLLTVGTVSVVVDGITAAQLHDASHFMF